MGDFLHYIFHNFRGARQDHSQAVEEDEVYGGHRRDGKGLLFPRSTEPFKRGRRRFAEAIAEITARETIKKPIKRAPSEAPDCRARKMLIPNWLPRMDSNHDKVIQSHLFHYACAIGTTFSVFRAASLRVCPNGRYRTLRCGRILLSETNEQRPASHAAEHWSEKTMLVPDRASQVETAIR